MTVDYKYENRWSQYIKYIAPYVSEFFLPTLLDAYFFLNSEGFFTSQEFKKIDVFDFA